MEVLIFLERFKDFHAHLLPHLNQLLLSFLNIFSALAAFYQSLKLLVHHFCSKITFQKFIQIEVILVQFNSKCLRTWLERGEFSWLVLDQMDCQRFGWSSEIFRISFDFRWGKLYDVDVICFEASDKIGGLWRYKPTETDESSVMKSTVINTSKELCSYSDFPPEPEMANYMHNTEMLRYDQFEASLSN